MACRACPNPFSVVGLSAIRLAYAGSCATTPTRDFTPRVTTLRSYRWSHAKQLRASANRSVVFRTFALLG
jgi:hypothetical protein